MSGLASGRCGDPPRLTKQRPIGDRLGVAELAERVPDHAPLFVEPVLRSLSSFAYLPAASFSQYLTILTSESSLPAVRLAVPLVGPAEDFHLQVVQLVTTTNRTVPGTALRAMPGTPKKKGDARGISLLNHIQK